MCGFSPFHKWGKWEVVEKGEVLRRSRWNAEQRHVGTTVVQSRTCERCNKKQFDVQHIDLVDGYA